MRGGAGDDHAKAIAARIAAELALDSELSRFASGSVPVFALGNDYVIKLFPIEERAFFETERAALERVNGRLSIPTPRVVTSGERDGWWYVVMTKLRGRSLAQV